jgi:hypothetical protein
MSHVNRACRNIRQRPEAEGRQAMRTGNAAAAWTMAALLSLIEPAQAQPCPFAGQKPMLIVQMFFGTDGGAVSPTMWSDFLKSTVTPRLPDGFTVYDGYGQWQDPATRRIERETSHTLLVAVEDSRRIRLQIEDIARVYRTQFHQQSVGLVTSHGCGRF